jgi:integrase/recombinase XerD
MKKNNLNNRHSGSDKSIRIVPYLLPEEVQKLVDEAKKGRNGERDSLFILLLYQTGLRISEALSLTLAKIEQFEGKPVLNVIGKGNRPRLVSCPITLAQRLMGYVCKMGLNSQHRIFPFNRTRGWQIIKQAAIRAGFGKRVFPHLLRHSDAIERLRQTGNPKALQHHLGHSSISMVMRYLSTLTQEDSLRIQQQVEFKDKNDH